MITKKTTKNMTREEWLTERRKSIGGSDAASVLNLNPWNSAYALWAEKTGAVIPEDISDKEAVRLGNDLEQYVAERFMEATGKKVRRENSIITNSDYPFAHANPDRMVIGEDAGLECKTTSSWEIISQLKDGEIPPNWYCQMTHYMMVTGAKKWYLAALAFGHGFYWMEIRRNDAEISALALAEKDFWRKVEERTPPTIDGSDATAEAIKTIYRESTPGMAVDLSICGANIETYNALCKQIKELEFLKLEHENQIKNCLGNAESGFYGATKITWKASNRKTFDRKLFEQHNGLIPDEYFKVSETRTFRVTVKGA